MEPHSGWNPMKGRELDTVKGYGGNKEPQKKISGVRVAIVVFALAIIGIAICFPASRELAKSLAIGIWDMLCNIANACSDFIEYVKHQRST